MASWIRAFTDVARGLWLVARITILDAAGRDSTALNNHLRREWRRPTNH